MLCILDVCRRLLILSAEDHMPFSAVVKLETGTCDHTQVWKQLSYKTKWIKLNTNGLCSSCTYYICSYGINFRKHHLSKSLNILWTKDMDESYCIGQGAKQIDHNCFLITHMHYHCMHYFRISVTINIKYFMIIWLICFNNAQTDWHQQNYHVLLGFIDFFFLTQKQRWL